MPNIKGLFDNFNAEEFAKKLKENQTETNWLDCTTNKNKNTLILKNIFLGYRKNVGMFHCCN